MHPAQPFLLDEWLTEWAPHPPVYGPATRFLEALIDTQPENAWDFIQALVERATDDALDWVGAGPLEDLLCEHGPALIDRVERLATTNARFRKCLTSVWGENRMEPSTYARMKTAAGGVKK